jgi:hypothetical protein
MMTPPLRESARRERRQQDEEANQAGENLLHLKNSFPPRINPKYSGR